MRPLRTPSPPGPWNPPPPGPCIVPPPPKPCVPPPPEPCIWPWPMAKPQLAKSANPTTRGISIARMLCAPSVRADRARGLKRTNASPTSSRDRSSLDFSREPFFSTSRDDATTYDGDGNANHRLDTRIHIGIHGVRRPTSSADSPRFGRHSSACSTCRPPRREDWRLRLPHLRCRKRRYQQRSTREVFCSWWPPFLS